MDPKRTFSGDIESFKVIKKYDFVYNPRIPNTRFPIALNVKQDCTMLVSPAYVTFNICKKQLLDEEYLILILQRETFSRKVLFNTWGSSTPFLRHEDLCEIKIPIPDLEVQKSIACIYKVYKERKDIFEKLKAQIKNLCPILIKGSLEEVSA